MLTLAYCLDEGYLPCTLVSLHSALESSTSPADVIIFHDGFGEKARNSLDVLVRLHPGARLILRNLSELAQGRAQVEGLVREKWQIPHLSRASPMRLLLPLLTERRVIYLDGDTLVRHDLNELFDVDLGDAVIGACKDAPALVNYHQYARNLMLPGNRRWHADYYRRQRSLLGFCNFEDYVNTGVMVIEPNRIRESELAADWFDLTRTQDFPAADQDWINIAARGKIAFLDPKWNSIWGNAMLASPVLPREVRQTYAPSRRDPAIVHFCTGKKPWNSYRALWPGRMGHWARVVMRKANELQDATGLPVRRWLARGLHG